MHFVEGICNDLTSLPCCRHHAFYLEMLPIKWLLYHVIVLACLGEQLKAMDRAIILLIQSTEDGMHAAHAKPV